MPGLENTRTAAPRRSFLLWALLQETFFLAFTAVPRFLGLPRSYTQQKRSPRWWGDLPTDPRLPATPPAGRGPSREGGQDREGGQMGGQDREGRTGQRVGDRERGQRGGTEWGTGQRGG